MVLDTQSKKNASKDADSSSTVISSAIGDGYNNGSLSGQANTLSNLKVMPHSIEAEQMLLACLLLDEDSYIEVAGVVYERHFYRKEHQIIFRHISRLKENKRNIDAVTVAVSLEQSQELEYIGGHDYINSLVEAIPSASNIRSYAEIIRERYVLRELVKASAEISESAYSPGERDIDVLLDGAEQKIFSIKDLNSTNKQFADIKSLLEKVLARAITMAQREDKSAVTGIATHFYELDQYTSGLQRGELVIVAGRPGMGKTAFALNVASNVALKNRLPVAIFSLEMTGEQLVQRVLSSSARVDQGKIKRGDLNDDDMDSLYIGLDALKKAPLHIAEAPGINVIDLRARVRRLKDQVGELGLVVIDYVQIMSGIRDGRGGSSNRAQEISDISRSLKSLALELNVPVILLSQLNRDVESRQDKRPNIADLRESGALEQDADIIILLYRESYYDKEAKNQLAEINIAKNRSGSTGMIQLAFLGQYTLFDNPYVPPEDYNE